MGKRKDKNYYMKLASTNSRAAKTSQIKLKAYKEGFREGLNVRRD